MEVKGLRYWRERRVLTQRELAARAGVPQSTVARIEKRGTARQTIIRKLAEALAVDPAELLEPEPGEAEAAA